MFKLPSFVTQWTANFIIERCCNDYSERCFLSEPISHALQCLRLHPNPSILFKYKLYYTHKICVESRIFMSHFFFKHPWKQNWSFVDFFPCVLALWSRMLEKVGGKNHFYHIHLESFSSRQQPKNIDDSYCTHLFYPIICPLERERPSP